MLHLLFLLASVVMFILSCFYWDAFLMVVAVYFLVAAATIHHHSYNCKGKGTTHAE